MNQSNLDLKKKNPLNTYKRSKKRWSGNHGRHFVARAKILTYYKGEN